MKLHIGYNDSTGKGKNVKTFSYTLTERSDAKVHTLELPTFPIKVESGNATLLNVKEAIFKKMGWEVARQRLIYAGNQLMDNRTLNDYNIQKEGLISVVLRLRPS
mmetsp:Transcript_10282/g.11357  ORF Transcript_10282/g.11357 Transcript_10282/m.11357 type:complete len:105 (+) Transcript_10282:15-329(+)